MVEYVDDPTSSSTTRFRTTPMKRISDRIANPAHVVSPNPNTELANKLASEFWSRLSFSRLADEAGHRGIEQVVRVVSSSHSQIVAWYGDMVQLVDAICRAAIEFRGDLDVSDAFRRQLASDMTEKMKTQGVIPLPPRSFVDYKFADLDPAIAMDKAERELERHCLQLASHFFSLLDQLQKKNLVGNVQRSDAACRFTFCRRVAILKRGTTRREERSTEDPDYADDWRKAYFIDTYDTTPVDVQHRHALHVHQVRNPVLSDIETTRYPLPDKYRQLVDACPDWVRPSLRVLEGDLFREEQMEWDLLSETRPDEQLVSSEWQRCPAIVIGDYVLAGWNDREIADEEQQIRSQQNLAEKQFSERQAKRYDAAVWCIGTLSIITMAMSVFGGATMSLIAILLGVAAMFIASQSARHRMSPRESPANVMFHAARVGSVIFAVQGVLFGILYLSLPAFGLAVFFAIAASFLPGITRDVDTPQG